MSVVVRYKNDGRSGCFCQIKLDSGERILISIAVSGIKVFKLILRGLIPIKIIWNCPISKLYSTIDKFIDPEDPMKHPLDSVRDALLKLKSIKEVEDFLAN
jgi:hypothetical protein